MPKPLFRVKRYAHPKYKFVVRAKVGGEWKRRYFVSKKEANAYAGGQNALSFSRAAAQDSDERTVVVSARSAVRETEQVHKPPAPPGGKGEIEEAEKLDAFYSNEDPWGYRTNTEDAKRRAVLLAELPRRNYTATLDIGCGNGFVTMHLPGQKVLGIDLSSKAIEHARRQEDGRVSFVPMNLFDLDPGKIGRFDLVVITGVLYSQYIGKASLLAQTLIDRVLSEDGILASVHIDDWYQVRFPYLLAKQISYPYREYTHLLELYYK